MKVLKRVFSFVIAYCLILSFGCCGYDSSFASLSENEPAGDNIAETTLTYPSDIKVSYSGKNMLVAPWEVNWAYEVNEEEWSSVVTDTAHPIDRTYKNYFEPASEGKLTIDYTGAYKPDAVTYVHKYPISMLLTVEDPDDLPLTEAIERRVEYEDYIEVELTDEEKFNFPLVLSGDDFNGYIYDVCVVWDHASFRGTAKFSFLIEEGESNGQ